MIQAVSKRPRIPWNKSLEFDWRELVELSRAELVKVGKRYKSVSKKNIDVHDRLYRMWFEACVAICMKSMPSQKAREPEEETPEQLPFVVRINGILDDSRS